MARLDITVTLHSRWIWETGDGTSCCKCGDPAWLKQLRLLIQVGTEPESPTEISSSASPAVKPPKAKPDRFQNAP